MTTQTASTAPGADERAAPGDPPPPATPSSSTFRALLRLAPFVRPALPRLIVSAVMAGVATLCGLAFPLVIKTLIDGPIAHHDLAGLWWPTVLLVLLGISESALFFFRRVMAARPSMMVEATMRSAVYRHLQQLPIAFHDRWSAGQLLSRAVTDLTTVRRFVIFGATFLLVNAATFVIGVVILLFLAWPLGLVVASCSVPVLMICIKNEFRYRVLARRSQDQVGDLATVVEESVLGVRILKSFGRSAHIGRAFTAQARDLRTTELGKARLVSYLWASVVAIPEFALGISVLLGVLRVAHGQMSAGTLVAFFGVALALRWPVEATGYLLAMANDAASATERYFEVLDAPLRVVDPQHPVPAPPPRGQLRFRNVSFAFDDAPGQELLRGIDLEIAPGETVAVVGATGSGKSTLTALVNRLYDVSAGVIELDGVDIRRLALADLRARVATAFEEATLFSASVRENVLLGRPTGSDADLEEALHVAQADFVHQLPFGLDTRIGEQGMSLSGGQRQRLALARAVVGRPALLVLDDPLSALDVHTEAQVEKALRSVLASTSALIVAHRASTVLLADRVVLLADGRITATGTHSHLMREVPAYRNLLTSIDDPDGISS